MTLPATPTMATSSRSRWRWTFLLAFAALACALLLAGLSAWFLGAVAIAGLSAAALTFNFHVPGALVRLFAIGRTAAKYGERLVGHDAALRDQLRRRSDLFVRMAAAPSVRQAGWQLGEPSRLADYLDDVEDLDNGRLRVDLPALGLGIGLLACLVATLILVPLAAAPIALFILALAALARQVARLGPHRLDEVRRRLRAGAQRLGAVTGSVVPLQAEGAWQGQLESCLSDFGRAEEEALALRRASAVLDAAASAFGPAAALAVMTTAWLTGHRQEALLVPAFLAFSWLALTEAAQGASRTLVAELHRRAAAREIERLMGGGTADEVRPSTSDPVRARRPTSLRLTGLRRRAPDGLLIGSPLDITFEAGRPTVLVGPSGCGKTSLLKQIAGWIGDDHADAAAFSLSASQRRALAVFCPHDAAILADTVRANLFAPKVSDQELQTALSAMELSERIEAAGGLDAWIRQDSLSLGEAQRLSLARIWLSDQPIVLLDEPTEHLGEDQASRILNRLLERLENRIVILSTHRAVAGTSVLLRL